MADSRATLADLLLDGFAAVGERRYQAGAALLRQAIAPLAAGQPIPDDALPHLMAVGQAAGLLYDDSARYQMEKRWVAELRDRGAIAALLTALGIQRPTPFGTPLRRALDTDAIVDVGDASRGPGGGHRMIVRGPGADRAGQDHQPAGGGLD